MLDTEELWLACCSCLLIYMICNLARAFAFSFRPSSVESHLSAIIVYGSYKQYSTMASYSDAIGGTFISQMNEFSSNCWSTSYNIATVSHSCYVTLLLWSVSAILLCWPLSRLSRVFWSINLNDSHNTSWSIQHASKQNLPLSFPFHPPMGNSWSSSF